MHCKDITPSSLPSFLLPCLHCGHRMAITGVTPALIANGVKSNDLADVTHTCAQCGATLIRTIPSRSGEASVIAHRV
jgi:hypothetical protein